MLFSTLLLLSSTLFGSFATARNSHRSTPHLGSRQRYANSSYLLDKSKASDLLRRDSAKYVFMHHIVGNTYPYTLVDWEDDWRRIRAKGVDAVALNIGSSDWQRTQISLAYQAANNVNNGLKLFYSFDFTEMGCNLDDFVNRVNLYSNHPSQFKVNGKAMISSFSGDCLGNSGWQALKDRTNGYLMPFVWGIEGQFSSWTSLDSWQCWGCAWPQGNYPKNMDDDNYYMSQLGSRYAAAVSPWFFTHYGYKNRYLRGDDWLFVNRWEQLMSVRHIITFVELATWNDYGESSYLGPIKGAQPDGTTWTNGFPHTAWHDMSEYFITAFKTGSYPAIAKDEVYFWARPHPRGASPSGDSIGRPTGWDWAEDSLWAVVFATSSASVTLKCGGSSQTFNVNAGLNKLKLPLAAGSITVQMMRNGQTIINHTPVDYNFNLNPQRYNFNAYVGAATATATATSSSSATTSSTTSSTTTPPAATTTVVAGLTWVVRGCYSDSGAARVVDGPSNTDGTQTIAKCLATCKSLGLTVAGVEYANQCFCSSNIRVGASKVAENQCARACGGNPGEICGDAYRINIYEVLPSTTTTTTPTPAPTGWSYHGCVAEGTTGSSRALVGATYNADDMTPQHCQELCASFKYAGLEYRKECYCGDTLNNNGATGAIIADTRCSEPCAGDSSQKCGGAWTLGIYTKPSSPTTVWRSAGCYIDGDLRMLRGSYISQVSMTTQKCIDRCDAGGFTIAGTQYGVECYCGSTLYKNGNIGTATAAAQCDVACSGDTSQICGGSWRSNLYLKPGTMLT